MIKAYAYDRVATKVKYFTTKIHINSLFNTS